ncbi:MAG: VWA domain-containing protein [gamma proteobacterium symbiont of Taylorina sp.]|nr:VWA domain-containing protein [gamma proteobacterium symbiont of Taylorina sp.]
MIPVTFHFLRPEWLWAILPVGLFLFFVVRLVKQKNNWEKVCDAPLLQYQLMQEQRNTKKSEHLMQWLRPFSFLWLLFSITLIAIAGPSWEKKQQPVFQQDDALVIILDLSLSMNAKDIKPSRLERAKLKLIDILKQKKEGQSALIAFAGDAHTVSPLTIDNKTIISLLPALEVSIMPLSGSHINDALLTAKDLLINSGFMQGDILLMTDGVDSEYQADINKLAKQLHQQGYKLSIIGVGSHSGSPIPLPGSGGFIKDKSGQVILSKLTVKLLKKLAQSGGGAYHKLSLDDSDFQALLKKGILDNNTSLKQDSLQENRHEQWVDAGAYLTLFIIPFFLLIFRRGLLSISILLVIIPSIYSEPLLAQTTLPEFVNSDNWNNLWLNKDQRGQKAFKRKNFSQAAEQFDNTLWKAGAHYQAGEFEQAVEQYEQFDDAESLYNKGNALANLQKFEQAIESYDKALEKDPDLLDAGKSRDYIKQLLEQQKQQPDQQQSGDQKQDQQDKDQQASDSDKSESQKNDQSEDNNQQSDSDNNPSEQNKTEQNNSSEKDQSSEQQQSEKNDSDDAQEQSEQEQMTAEEKESQSAQQQDIEETDASEGENTSEDVLSRLSQEEQQSLKQWLQRIPDNPGELLRIKFRNNSLNKQRQKDAPAQYEGNPW